MTITIQTEEDEQRQLKLTAEVSEDRVEQAMRLRARKLSKDVRIPGFRRGKVPYGVILQRFGRDLIRAEAVEDMVQEIYEEAVEQADVSAYGQPSLDDMTVEPLVLTFVVPLEPIVTLGDYRTIRKEVEDVQITDEAIEEALEQVQVSHQEIESVDRASESGDVLTISGKGELLPMDSDEGDQPESVEVDTETSEEAAPAQEPSAERELLFEEESVDILLDGEVVFPGTTFVDALIGKSSGDECEFSITFPDDYEEEELAGRTAEFSLSVLDVKKRELPPLDDDLAKLEGDNETLEELRESLARRLQDEAEAQAKDALIEEMVDELLEDATLTYPPAAIEAEIDESAATFRNQVSQSGWDFDDYLRLQNLTEEALREDLRESSEARLRRRLAMRQFVLNEKLRIEMEDVDALIDERVGRFDNEELKQSMRDFYLSGSGFDMISSEVLSEKVYERIRAILTGTAPDLADLDELDEAGTDESEEE